MSFFLWTSVSWRAHLDGQLVHKAVGVGLAVKAHAVVDLAAHRLAHAAGLHVARVAPVRVIPQLCTAQSCQEYRSWYMPDTVDQKTPSCYAKTFS